MTSSGTNDRSTLFSAAEAAASVTAAEAAVRAAAAVAHERQALALAFLRQAMDAVLQSQQLAPSVVALRSRPRGKRDPEVDLTGPPADAELLELFSPSQLQAVRDNLATRARETSSSMHDRVLARGAELFIWGALNYERGSDAYVAFILGAGRTIEAFRGSLCSEGDPRSTPRAGITNATDAGFGKLTIEAAGREIVRKIEEIRGAYQTPKPDEVQSSDARHFMAGVAIANAEISQFLDILTIAVEGAVVELQQEEINPAITTPGGALSDTVTVLTQSLRGNAEKTFDLFEQRDWADRLRSHSKSLTDAAQLRACVRVADTLVDAIPSRLQAFFTAHADEAVQSAFRTVADLVSAAEGQQLTHLTERTYAATERRSMPEEAGL